MAQVMLLLMSRHVEIYHDLSNVCKCLIMCVIVIVSEPMHTIARYYKHVVDLGGTDAS